MTEVRFRYYIKMFKNDEISKLVNILSDAGMRCKIEPLSKDMSLIFIQWDEPFVANPEIIKLKEEKEKCEELIGELTKHNRLLTEQLKESVSAFNNLLDVIKEKNKIIESLKGVAGV